MHIRSLLPGLIAIASLAGCTLFRAPPAAPSPESPGTPPAGSVTAPSPATPQPGSATPAPPAPPPPKQFHLGAAASALVTQAHTQLAGGDSAQAAATLERALRIEPENPLVWIELGRVRLAEGNPAQADAMARKALALARGDTAAQSSAWRLIADSLRAGGNNLGAADADRRAGSLAPH
ncbi:MAG: tetratricopeptide repeat protein [Gammaproteobacteria bacterium]|nr:tetratricopeptide repeat protein [Gammaproteobacteria bacterium]